MRCWRRASEPPRRSRRYRPSCIARGVGGALGRPRRSRAHTQRHSQAHADALGRVSLRAPSDRIRQLGDLAQGRRCPRALGSSLGVQNRARVLFPSKGMSLEFASDSFTSAVYCAAMARATHSFVCVQLAICCAAHDIARESCLISLIVPSIQKRTRGASSRSISRQSSGDSHARRNAFAQSTPYSRRDTFSP